MENLNNEAERVIVRGNNSGVFCGNLIKFEGTTVSLSDVRRLWYWDGAASISQLAATGTSKPQNCKFTVPVSRMIITDVLEIISMTPEAIKNIDAVQLWKF